MGIDQFKDALREKMRGGGIGSGKDFGILKQLITKWADGIEHHDIKNFGNDVEIISAVGRSSYFVSLDFEYEKRLVKTGTYSYSGKNIFSKVVKLTNNNDLWSLNLPLVDKFENAIQKYGIKEEVFSCNSCGGAGAVSCHNCGGRGQGRCDKCQGMGKIRCNRCGGNSRVSCSSCSGKGQTYDYKRCSYCMGTGHQACPDCIQGAVSCPSCDGHGILVCSVCQGSGQLRCSQCQGTGQLAQCQYLQEEFIHQHAEEWVHSSGVSEDLHKRIVSKSSESFDVGTLDDVDIPLGLFDGLEDRDFGVACKKALSQLRGIVDTIKENCRILRQRITVKKVEVVEILYRYQGKEYQIWSFGTSGMWASVSPISERRLYLFDVAKDKMNQKDFSTALETIDQVIVMAAGEGNHAKEYKEAKEKIESAIRGQYLIGGAVGGTIIPILGTILGLLVGLIYWNVFGGKIRLNRQRFFYPFFVSLIICLFVGTFIFIK